jgi:hypothetical protein
MISHSELLRFVVLFKTIISSRKATKKYLGAKLVAHSWVFERRLAPERASRKD